MLKLLADKAKRKTVQEYAEVALAAWTIAAFVIKKVKKEKVVD